MQLKMLTVKNFRNFSETNISLTNKNVIFGMNDVGKTNFLYAIRFLLDRKIRNLGFKESDYFQRDTSKKIEIILEIDISDKDDDSQNIISKVGKYRDKSNLESIYIKLEGEFDNFELIGNIVLYWGNDDENLELVPQSGNFSELDKLFKIIYIDPLIDMSKVFDLNKRRLLKVDEENDESNLNKIQNLSNELNDEISNMSIVKNFQWNLTNRYKDLKDEDISIVLKSEMAIKGVFNDIHPYIQSNKDDSKRLYPTSGDGRKKILAYALLNYLNSDMEIDSKIPLFLIEEPENSLHRSMRISLSKQLFNNKEVYKYFMVSTHSAEILYEMDEANLIRIYNDEKTDCKSTIYNVPKEFTCQKKELNNDLAQALFTDKVLLVEGPSEKVLFERILELLNPTYELDGGFILMVDGVKFKPYREILMNLGIRVIIKTDNDLQETSAGKSKVFKLSGYNRCLELLGEKCIDDIKISYNSKDRAEKIKKEKGEFYKSKINEIENLFIANDIYMSKIDLENDLYEAIKDELDQFHEKDPVKFLQQKKLIRMLELCGKLNEYSCKKIVDHENFRCLKGMLKDSDRRE